MNTDSAQRLTFIASISILVLFVAGRVLGLLIPSAGWAFNQWAYLPWWYIALWIVGGTSVIFLLARWTDWLEGLFESPLKRILGLVILAGLLFAYRYNSFLYGGGNYQIAKLAQTDSIIHRWYEFGSLWLADILYQAVSVLSFTANSSAYIAWKMLGLIGTVLSLIAALKISKGLSDKGAPRIALFLVLFFGPQTLVYFNFVGFEPLLIAVIYWFVFFALKASNPKQAWYLIPLWLAAAAGLFLHVSMVMLLPAALYITLTAMFRGKSFVPYLLGLAAIAGLAVAAYLKAYGSMEYGQYLLFLHDKNLQSDYNLFTGGHCLDIAKLIFMTCPQALIVVLLLIVRRRKSSTGSLLGTTSLLSLAGLTIVFMMEPTRGMALDAPIMAAFLMPLGLMLAVLLNDQFRQTVITRNSLTIAAGLALLVPLSIMPVYSRIAYADGYIQSFLDSHPYFWNEGGTAVRDAYFYHEDDPTKPNANRWDQAIPVESEDYLDLTAAKEYMLAQQYSNALQKLYKLKTKNRYWLEPRFLIATVQSKQGRYDLAKPEIDTCLMINPYDKASLVSRYRYYLDINDIPRAVDEVSKAIDIYPNDNEMKADLAIYWYRSRNFKAADSLSVSLIARDSTLAYPYLIRGFIAELKNEPKQAIEFYQSFISLAPDAPETPQVRKKLNNLVLDQRKKSR